MKTRRALLIAVLLAASATVFARDASLLPQANASASPGLNPKRMIARIWQGRTRTAQADAYEKYLQATGVATILKTQGNHGVEVLRRPDGAQTEFLVISYWESVAAIQKFAGADYRKAHVLARDAEFLIDAEPTVVHFEVVRAGGR
jgi:heme-degrading monooxygenase HmoA